MRDLEELFSNLNPLAQNFETPIVANDVKPVLQNSAPSFSYVADGNTWVPTNSPVAAGGNSATEDWSSFASEELSLIRVIIENDKAAEFESFLDESEVKNVEEGMLLAFAGCELCPYDILGKICQHRASNCANALLSHKLSCYFTMVRESRPGLGILCQCLLISPLNYVVERFRFFGKMTRLWLITQLWLG